MQLKYDFYVLTARHRRRVESAEIMNRQTGDRYEEQANMRNTELLMMLILMESQVR